MTDDISKKIRPPGGRKNATGRRLYFVFGIVIGILLTGVIA
jgi:hypothetical protein